MLELIETMNRTLGQLYNDYRPVWSDNSSSNETAKQFEAVGMDPAWAAAELRRQCVQFNRGKHGKGRLPGTLTYFRRGLLGAWSRQEAGDQMELPLVSIQAPIVSQRSNAAAPRPVLPSLPAPVPAGNTERTIPTPAEAHPHYRGGFNWRALLDNPPPLTARVA